MSSPPVGWMTQRRVQGKRLILAYHGIIPEGATPAGEPALFVAQRDFAMQLDVLAAEADVVPLDRIDEPGNGRPRVAITIDDAYRGAVNRGSARARRTLTSGYDLRGTRAPEQSCLLVGRALVRERESPTKTSETTRCTNWEGRTSGFAPGPRAKGYPRATNCPRTLRRLPRPNWLRHSGSPGSLSGRTPGRIEPGVARHRRDRYRGAPLARMAPRRVRREGD